MKHPLHLFEAFGIEIEYMIVDSDTCAIRPLAELLLVDSDGSVVNEVAHGPLCRSNELVQHVIELKTNGPHSNLAECSVFFQHQVREINRLLAPHRCTLLPGSTHPFMAPRLETRIWEKEHTEIYQAFNSIFDCRGHGWSNLQSMHINLPFHGVDEFFLLHAAVRFILPFIPALAASSPFQDGRATGFLDSRMDHYGKNCARVPAVTGLIVPEPVASPHEYHTSILAPIYHALEPYDPQALLREEWVNARGAIARFERDAVEIRVIDSQECPAADLAVAELICAVIKRLTEDGAELCRRLNEVPTELLHRLLRACITDGEQALVSDAGIRAVLELPETIRTAGQLWLHWAQETPELSATGREHLQVIFEQGPLARRMRAGCQPVTPDNLVALCRSLTRCLDEGFMYQVG